MKHITLNFSKKLAQKLKGKLQPMALKRLFKKTSNTAYASPFVNRAASAALALGLLATSSHVGVAGAVSPTASQNPFAEPRSPITNENPFAERVEKEVETLTSFTEELPIAKEMKKPEPTAPVKKVWNTINAPDLETKPEYSSEAAVRTMVVPTSAYTSDVAETDSSPFTTADGSQVRDGIIAANFLPHGTRVRIPDYFGNKVFEVHDRMNARYQTRVDIWMLEKSDAYAWGVRNVKIEILP